MNQFLVLILVFYITSALSDDWSEVQKLENVKNDDHRVPKYNVAFWAPQDVTVTFKKPISNFQNLLQSRSLTDLSPIGNQTFPLVTNALATIKPDEKEVRIIQNRKHHHGDHDDHDESSVEDSGNESALT